MSLPGDPGYGNRFSSLHGAKLYEIQSKTFPDGETYTRLLKPVEEDSVLVIQSMFPEQDKRFFETLQILDVLSRYGKRTILLLTYMAYARQDKVFLEGEPVSSKIVLRHLLSGYNVYKILIIEPHSEDSYRGFKDVVAINGVEILGRKIKEMRSSRDIVVVSPDQGGLERAKRLARILGSEYLVFRKYRDRYTGSIKTEAPENIDIVRNRDALIIDDILSTGGTIAETASILKRSSAREIYTACVHCLFISNALARILDSGVKEIYCGNTIKSVAQDPRVIYIDLFDEISKIIMSLI